MKRKQILKTLALTLGLFSLVAVQSQDTFVSNLGFMVQANAEAYTTVTQDGVTYWVYPDHAEVSGDDYGTNAPFNTSATGEINIASTINGKTVTKINGFAFKDNQSITKINIPSTVTSVGRRAFEGTKITELEIPPNVSSVGDSAFYNCTELTKVKFDVASGKLCDIGNSAFSGCTSLTDVTMPCGGDIGMSIFANCTSLEEFTVYNNKTVLPNYMFSGCTSLRKVTVSPLLSTIGKGTFQGCTSLTSVVSAVGTNLPDRVITIDNSAFKDCTSLTSINIKDKVSTLYYNAFQGCSNLTRINVSDNKFDTQNLSEYKRVVIKDSADNILDKFFARVGSSVQVYLDTLGVESYDLSDSSLDVTNITDDLTITATSIREQPPLNTPNVEMAVIIYRDNNVVSTPQDNRSSIDLSII